MSRFRVLGPATVVLVAAILVTATACATPAGSGGRPDVLAPRGQGSDAPIGPAPTAPVGEVTAQGTVLDTRGDVQLCLGVIAASDPPQCSGIRLLRWSWEAAGGFETTADVTWGTYAVQGSYDGETFTVTAPPIPLALYDPMPFPEATGGEPGTADEATLRDIQDELQRRLGESVLMSYPEDGRLWVDVVWDDGTWQRAADDEFGPGVVVIRSALREAG